jgi:N-acetylmuramoyl-L-alanine amidase
MSTKPFIDAVDTMARTIWGEARNQGTLGMVAVANVIMNRVALDSWFGYDVISVCKKPYQFSCWLKNDPNYEKLRMVNDSDESFRKALMIADFAAERLLKDITNGADHYHTVSIMPRWAKGKKPVAKIGSHIFYKLAAADE